MPRDLLQLYPLDGKLLTLRTTEDSSTTRLLLQLRETGVRPFAQCLTTELCVTDVQLLARELLQWLVDNDHTLPELPVDVQLDDEDENPSASEPGPPPDQAGTLLVYRTAGRVVIDGADPWVVVSGSLLSAMEHGAIPGAVVTGQTFTIEDSDGRRVQYAQHAPAGLGSWLCRRTSWRPEPLGDLSAQPATVHVIPEHTR